MVSCLQHCRVRPLTHDSHKHSWSHVYSTLDETIDTWQSQTHMVSCLQHCRMRPLTHDSHKHSWSHVYNTVGWDHWHITVTTTHGLMSTILYNETIDTWQSQTHMVSCLQHCRMRPLTHDSHKHTWSHLICNQTKSVNVNSIINDTYSKFMIFYKILYV